MRRKYKIDFGAIGSAFGSGLKMAGGGIAAGWGLLSHSWKLIRLVLVNLWPWLNAFLIWKIVLKSLANNLVYGTFVAQLFTTQQNPNFPEEIVHTVNIITGAVMVILALCSFIPKTDELRRLIQIAIIGICGLLNGLLGNAMWTAMAFLVISVFAEVIFMDKYGKRAPSKKHQLVIKDGEGNTEKILELGKV